MQRGPPSCGPSLRTDAGALRKHHPVRLRVSSFEHHFSHWSSTMAQRLIVGLQRGADWDKTKKGIVQHGATCFREPSPEQPDVAVITVDDEKDAEAVLTAVRRIDG